MVYFNLGLALRHPLKTVRYYNSYRNRIPYLCKLFNKSEKEIQDFMNEFESKTELFDLVKNAAKNGLGDLSGVGINIKSPIQYITTRILQPNYVVETGVGIGISSLFFLEAMKMNGKGELHSIDLPRKSYKVSNGVHHDFIPEDNEPGFLIPKNYRKNWHLHLGDSKEILPKLLEQLQEIEIFCHDSEHTYDFMMFEFNTAWKFLINGGILMSDDIDWNKAFSDFAHQVNSTPISFSAFGAIQKPTK